VPDVVQLPVPRRPGGRSELVTASARSAARARSRLRGLLLILAPDGRCAICHKRKPLELDHVDGAGWARRALNRWARVNRYIREFQAGVRLRALCRECNAGHNPKKGRAS
jgi:hypothetical protein